ncbi:MAG TPA: AAA family ATPase [Candidatus Polarisedimenticolaceae bacterium]|nr:AAA family ATPase [Candidatus Polarisedimenticolaceae bacterium]
MTLVLGITGPNAAGKGEVSGILAARGFATHSLSDVVREEAAALGLPPEREHLIRVGTSLRREGGAGVLAQRILPRLRGRDVVDSIRNPAEVDVLRSLAGFVLVGVEAPAELRFERSRRRARAGDPETFEEFLARERQENSADPAGQQLAATFALADRVLVNDGNLDALRARVDDLLAGLG